MINISIDNFDKAFWLSSTNIRNLMRAAIDIDINIGAVESSVGALSNSLDNIDSVLSGIQDQIDSIVQGGGGSGEGGSIDPLDPLYVNLDQRVKANTSAIASHGHDISDLVVRIIKLEARVDALEKGG